MALALKPEEQQQYLEALKTPPSSPDYAEAKSFIRSANAKGLGRKGK